MPHIVLEYSSGLGPGFDASALLQELHEAVGATEGFELDRIKSRAVALRTHLVGRAPGELVHATVAFSPGRAPRLREELGRRLLEILTAGTRREGEGPGIHRSVEIRQFEAGMYFASRPGR
jgi:5-carboxymethyl-2-hydroxymuconate isomerase